MQFKTRDDDARLIIRNAITWFDELVRINGCQCSTSTFIHNALTGMLEKTYSDGACLWDKEMVEMAYPQIIEQIKGDERDKIYGIIRFDVADYIERRLKDGK